MGQLDIFNNEIPLNKITSKPKVLSKYQRWKMINNYRKSSDKSQICKTCEYHISGKYRTKFLHKCNLLGLSHSSATDIKVFNVCDLFIKEF